jgi:hypothetical protein
MMMSAVYQTNMLSWILKVIADWNNILQVDMSLHSTYYPDSKRTRLSSYSLMLRD